MAKLVQEAYNVIGGDVMHFHVLLHPGEEDEGGYWAEIPELDGCFTQGDTFEQILDRIPEAIACTLDLDENPEVALTFEVCHA
jgi:predicted RNase H-like HicB family nuclease